MASKFSKFLFFTAATAAATAAVYYLVKKNEVEQKASVGSDEDEFEVYDEDLDAEPKGRSYVSLNLDNVESAFTKAKEVISDSYHHVKDTVIAGLEGASGGVRDFVDLTREGGDADVVDAPAAADKDDKPEKKADEKKADEKKADDKAGKDEEKSFGFKKAEYKTAKVEPTPTEPPKAEPPKAEPAKSEKAAKTPPPDDYSDLEEAGTPLIIDPEPEKEKSDGFFDEDAEDEVEDEWASLDREYASFKK